MELNTCKYFLLILSTIINIAAASSTDEIEASVEENYRLIETVIPYHYDVEIKAYLLENSTETEKLFKFDGITQIIIATPVLNVTSIVLHSKHLKIVVVQLHGTVDNIPLVILEYEEDIITDKVILTLESALETNKNYTLKFEYSGEIGENLHGFYRSSYINENLEKVWIGATQFEPNYARCAFPCFDEPKFKATFQLKINRENKYISTSNMKILNTTADGEGRSIDIFKTTPIMSTYLVAFLISDFKQRYSDNETLSILSRTDAFNQTQYALEIGVQLLEKFNEFTGIPYSSMNGIEKMDLAGIPDFEAGAMENWGLITFAEKNLYYDSNSPYSVAVFYKEVIARTISHEIAHMWFGNLVTCDWWTFSWLNEGFAKYFEKYIADQVLPEYKFISQFVVSDHLQALLYDGVTKSHPLTDWTVTKSSDFSRMFDPIIYSKGGSIIRMIAHMMGEDIFKMAIRNYLSENAYKTVTPDHLFNALNKHWKNRNVNLMEFLTDWTEKPGFPLITVKLNEDGRSFNISQRRYMAKNQIINTTSEWTIPFTFTTDVERDFQNTTPKIYLHKNVTEMVIDLGYKAEWIIANIQLTGFYRVNYDNNTWRRIGLALKQENFSDIHELNRVQIISDLLVYTSDEIVSYAILMEIFEYLRNEREYLPWDVAKFYKLRRYIYGNYSQLFRKYMLNNLNNVYEKLSFHSDDIEENPLDVYNREFIRESACYYGHTGCIFKAKQYFDDLILNKKEFASDLNRAVFCSCAREFGNKYTKYLWDMYKAEQDSYEKIDLLTHIGCSRNKKTFSKVLDEIFTQLAEDDRSYALGFTAVNDGNPELVFIYVKQNFTNFLSFFEEKIDGVKLLTHATSVFSSERLYKDVEEFYNSINDEVSPEMNILLQKNLNQIKENIIWSEKHMTDVFNYLDDNYGDSGSIMLQWKFIYISVFSLVISQLL